MMLKFNCALLLLCLLSFRSLGQIHNLSFAVVSDIHIGYDGAEESLKSTIDDINKREDVQFVLVTGDLTASGSDEQLLKAKKMLNRLNKKYFAVPGNHENAWSESGGTSFERIFGADKFIIEQAGILFVGTDCGPVLRHGPAHIPKDHLLWLDSVLQTAAEKPVIFVNHFPLTEEVDNAPQLIRLLRQFDIRLVICGHWHTNKIFDFSGIPGALCRSNLAERGAKSGYTIAHLRNNEISFSERLPLADSLAKPWMVLQFHSLQKATETPDVRTEVQQASGMKATQKWVYQHTTDIGSGFVMNKNLLYTGTTDGELLALSKATGEKKWSYKAAGKIFCTPALGEGRIVFTTTSGQLICISEKGELLWKFKSARALVASPLIKEGRVYIGASDGVFRCFDLKTGKIIWEFGEINGGFVQSAPLLVKDKLYFGAWNSKLYCLNKDDGALAWNWTNRKAFAYAPAAVPPVIVGKKLFIITPDNVVTCFDAELGKVIWQESKKEFPVWFSRGLSADGKVLYLKTVDGKCFGISTNAENMEVVWKSDLDLKHESTATPVIDNRNYVFVSTEKGIVYGIKKDTGKQVWSASLGSTPINHIELSGASDLFASTQDGKIVRLSVPR